MLAKNPARSGQFRTQGGVASLKAEVAVVMVLKLAEAFQGSSIHDLHTRK